MEKRGTGGSAGFWAGVREVAAERLVEEPWEGPTWAEGRRGMFVRLMPPAPGNLSKKDA
jgi:hypothetical protein